MKAPKKAEILHRLVRKMMAGAGPQLIREFSFPESNVPATSVSEEERERVFQEAWEKGNRFQFVFGTFSDIAIDPAANGPRYSSVRRSLKSSQVAAAH